MEVSRRFKDRDNVLLYSYYKSLGLSRYKALALSVYTFGDYMDSQRDNGSNKGLFEVAGKYYSSYRELADISVADYIGKVIYQILRDNPKVHAEDALESIKDNGTIDKYLIDLSGSVGFLVPVDALQKGFEEYEHFDVFNASVKDKADHNIIIVSCGCKDKWIQAGIIDILMQCTRHDRISLLAYGCNGIFGNSNDINSFIDKLFEVGYTRASEPKILMEIDWLLDNQTLNLYHISQVIILDNMLSMPSASKLNADNSVISENEYHQITERIFLEYNFKSHGVLIAEMDASKESLYSYMKKHSSRHRTGVCWHRWKEKYESRKKSKYERNRNGHTKKGSKKYSNNTMVYPIKEKHK